MKSLRVVRRSTFYSSCVSLCGVLSPSVFYVCFIDADAYTHVVFLTQHISTVSDSDLRPASSWSVVRHGSAQQRYITPGWFVYI
jgi:hypothetical protein